jgi:hypothetical protein
MGDQSFVASSSVDWDSPDAMPSCREVSVEPVERCNCILSEDVNIIARVGVAVFMYDCIQWSSRIHIHTQIYLYAYAKKVRRHYGSKDTYACAGVRYISIKVV